MSYWIELHCDKPSPATTASGGMACRSGSGNMPGLMTLRAPAQAAGKLLRAAKADGWKVVDGALCCPPCAKHWAEQERAS